MTKQQRLELIGQTIKDIEKQPFPAVRNTLEGLEEAKSIQKILGQMLTLFNDIEAEPEPGPASGDE